MRLTHWRYPNMDLRYTFQADDFEPLGITLYYELLPAGVKQQPTRRHGSVLDLAQRVSRLEHLVGAILREPTPVIGDTPALEAWPWGDR